MKKSTIEEQEGSAGCSARCVLVSTLCMGLVAAVLIAVVPPAMERRVCGHGSMGPIPQGPGVKDAPMLIGMAAVPKPLPPKDVPPHPFMAECGGPHIDMYNSDVSDWRGPLGRSSAVFSRSMGHRFASSMLRTFQPGGEVSSICYYLKGIDVYRLGFTLGMDLALFDPTTIEVIDLHEVGTLKMSLLDVWRGQQVDLSGGYYYVDDQGRVVNAGAGNVIQIVELAEAGGVRKWRLAESFDMNEYISEDAGNLIAVSPDYQGNLWFMAQGGLLGYRKRETGEVFACRVQGEVFENSMAIAPDGVYVATDHGLYRFEIDPVTGSPKSIWRKTYQRATKKKPGMLSWGTGTTPTLLGDDLVVFCDNGDDRVNLLVHDRRHGHKICDVPLFQQGASLVEISPIGYSDKTGKYDSIIVQNNYNAPEFADDYRGLAPGLTRIDVLPDRSGCVEVWVNHEVPSTTVPKLSTATGLIYTYTQLFDTSVDRAWYLAAVDFETGETVYRVSLGTGSMRHNYYATVDLGPNGVAYVGVVTGMVAVRDTE